MFISVLNIGDLQATLFLSGVGYLNVAGETLVNVSFWGGPGRKLKGMARPVTLSCSVGEV